MSAADIVTLRLVTANSYFHQADLYLWGSKACQMMMGFRRDIAGPSMLEEHFARELFSRHSDHQSQGDKFETTPLTHGTVQQLLQFPAGVVINKLLNF